MFFNSKKKPVMPVCTIGSPALTRVAVPVAEIDRKVLDLAQEMYRALVAFDGIGLAAPQVGVSLRLVVFDVPEPERKSDDAPLSPGEELLLPQMPFVAVNPQIVLAYGEEVEREEGCLSVPGLFAPVKRPSQVVFRTANLKGETVECECGGLLARCIQHELDHLDGKLFVDRVDSGTAAKIKARLDKMIRDGKSCSYRRTK